MSDHLGVTKQIDGCTAKFLRFAGPDNLVIEVNGAERVVTREFCKALPLLETNKEVSTPH
jgi:hypothetical protein